MQREADRKRAPLSKRVTNHLQEELSQTSIGLLLLFLPVLAPSSAPLATAHSSHTPAPPFPAHALVTLWFTMCPPDRKLVVEWGCRAARATAHSSSSTGAVDAPAGTLLVVREGIVGQGGEHAGDAKDCPSAVYHHLQSHSRLIPLL